MNRFRFEFVLVVAAFCLGTFVGMDFVPPLTYYSSQCPQFDAAISRPTLAVDRDTRGIIMTGGYFLGNLHFRFPNPGEDWASVPLLTLGDLYGGSSSMLQIDADSRTEEEVRWDTLKRRVARMRNR